MEGGALFFIIYEFIHRSFSLNMQQSTQLVKQGYLSLQQSNSAQAVEYFNQAKVLNPLCFDAWFALGNLYLQMNDLDQAVNMLQKAAKVSPDNPVAHGQLGVVLYRLQRLDEAINCYQKVIQLQADNPAAYANLAMVYVDIGNREKAVSCCLKAIKLKPDFTGAHILLASAYSVSGRFEWALDSYNDALKLETDNLTALAGKANVLIKLGNKKEAYETIKTKLDAGQIDPSIAIAYASASTTIDHESEAAAYLEKVLRRPSLTQMQRLQLHFSAGSLYDHMAQYDKAFQQYVSGNTLVQRSYDSKADKAVFDGIIEAFSHENFQKFPQVKQAESDMVPVFIIGMPRSGTSLVERILGAHAAVYPAGEMAEIPKLAELVSGSSNKKFPQNMVALDEKKISQLAQKHIKHLKKISGGMNMVIDKLPHNFLFLGLITLLFPNAKIIHCRRDPLDTCLSNYFQYFSGSLDYPYNLESLAEHYNHYQRIMEHWKRVLRLPMLEISYEDLVTNNEQEIRKLLSFLGLSWDDNCLRFNESGQVTRTASYEQVRKPVYTRSIGRWHNYEKHIKTLIDALASRGGG